MSDINEKRIREIVREELGSAFAWAACIKPPKPIIGESKRRVVTLINSAIQVLEKSGNHHLLIDDKLSENLSEVASKSSNSSASAGSRSNNSRDNSPTPSDWSFSATARTEVDEASSSPDFLKANASNSAEIKTSSSDVVSESVSIFTGIANLFRWIGRLVCIESQRGGK